MAFKTENKQLNILMGRARAKNNATNALKQQDINVDTLNEIESKEENQESDSLDIGGVSLASGIGVEPIGVSRSIEKAQEDINVASSMAGVGDPRDAGQIAFGMAKAAGEKNYVQDKPFEAAVAGFYDSALAQSAVNLAPAVAAYAGNIDLARGLGTVSNALTGPIPTLLTGALMGPSMKDPYNQTVAMGSGMLNKVSSAVMSTHFDVADKMARGVAGYNQGYYRGNLVSIEPGIFGVGKVMTGVTVPSGSIRDFEEAIKQAELQEDEDAASGYMQGNPAAMMQAGIDVSDFGSSTEAAQAGIGYSSYSPDGNPTGAAPSGSQYSYTGTFSTDDNNNNNNDGTGDPGGTDSEAGSEMGGEDVAFGGKIGMAMGDVAQKPTTEMGFIGGPPDQFTPQQTIADDIPKEVPEGTFVINAPAVEFAGKEDIKQMLVEAYEIMSQAGTDAGTDRTAQATKIPSKEQVDIMISRGEVVVPPEIAKVIGYDRLEKINNRGKKEVSRRQEESQQEEKPQAKQVAEGGFIGMQEGGNIEDEFGVTIKNVKFKEFYSSPEEARKEIDKILNNLPLEDALAIAMEGEADVLGDEGLEGVGHVFRNRARAEGYKDFGNSLAEELGKKTYGKNKIFQFNALEPTKFRNTLKRFKQNEDRYLKVRNIAEDIVAGSRKDFTKGALFFKNPTSSEAKDFKAKVKSGEYVETGRTVNPKNKVFAHIYYRPKDFSVVDETQPEIEQPINTESFATTNTATQPPRKIPESTGGSFLNRGSAYETGGATPAFR